MGHDPTKFLLGVTGSSDKPGTTVYQSDPATFLAGLAVRIGSDGLLTLTKGTNQWAGISLGASLSDTKKTSVLRAGSAVPIRLANERAYATVTVTSYANLVSGTDDSVTINGTVFTAQAGAATPGDATFQAATSNNATAASLAAQVNAHATIGAIIRATAVGAVVTLTSIAEGTAGNAYTIVYTDNDTNVGITLGNATGGHLNGGSASSGAIDYVTLGAPVYIDDASGEATSNMTGSTISNAVYVSAVLDGVAEDGTTVPVALVDMIGGL
jgi:hypothetical protein